MLTVYKASAGSGKTYTLAKLYIEKLLWDAQGNLRPANSYYHRHILAITFTNKATAEMKERIVARLQELSEGKCTDYETEFLKTHPTTSAQELQQAAKEALDNLLFDYAQFNVSTIDSFFQTVLRHFVFELDCEYDYELQLEEDDALRQSVFSLLQTMSASSKGDHLLQWVKKFVLEKVRTNSDWNVFGTSGIDDLVKFANILRNEEFMAYHQALQEYVSDFGSGSGKSRLSQFVAQIATKVKKKEDKMAKEESKIKDFIFAFDVSDLNNTLKNIRNGDPISGKIKNFKEWIEHPEKMKSQFKAAYVKTHGMPDVANLLKILEKYVAIADEIDVAKKVTANIWKLGLLGKISELLDQYRKDNGVILLSDTTDLIHKVLESGVPFLYERMGVWLNHFMIDEFQDTSRKQYENFKPLLENSLSGANYNLIIGDEKQSIYRFRNSDPNLFQNDLPTDFSSEYDDSEDLHINRRSTKLVIDFNNEFFKQILDYYAKNRVSFKKLQTTYGKLHQDYPAYSDEAKEAARIKGFVKLNLVYGTPTKSSGSLPYLKGSDGQPYYGKEGVLKHLPEYILEQHNKYNYPFGKILILVNRNKEGDEVVNAILEHNKAYPDRLINIVSAESLLLQNSAAVRMVISVLYFINSTQHAHSDEDEDIDTGKPTMQKLMQKRLKDQLYYKTLHDFGQALGKAGENADAGELMEKVFRNNDDLRQKPVEEQVEIFADQLKNLLPNPKNEQASLVGVVDKIIKEYLEPIGLNKGAETSFLLALQGVVLDFSTQRTNGGTIYEFLKYWEMKKDKLAISPGQNDDAVEVMTIHKAKGLERPCVIVPLADWDMEQMDRLCWLPKDNWPSTGDEPPLQSGHRCHALGD